MLNEKIEACSEIADLEGLYFVWRNLVEGVTSINSLVNLRLRHVGRVNLNIDYALLLFEQLNLIELNEDRVILLIQDKQFQDFDLINYQNWFSEILVDLLIREEVISFDGIKYNHQVDRYILPRFNIQYKYACYRNLLMSLGVLEKDSHGNFYINSLLSDYIIKENALIKKISEEELLRKLEIQRLQGESGEVFVIDYECNRLSLRNDVSRIRRISIIDVSAGYDIISFNDNNSMSLDRFIEVKTFKGDPHFYWSSNEIEVAKIKSKKYFLYLVDVDRLLDPMYEPIIICDPISYFENSLDWISSPKTYLFQKLF